MNTWKISPDGYTSPEKVYTPSGAPLQDVEGADRWSSSSRNRPRLCRPGDVLEVASGDYRNFRITHTYDRAGLDDFIRIIGGFDLAGPSPRPRILPNSVGGSQTFYLEWGGAHEIRGLDIIGDDMAGFFTERPQAERWHGEHPGFRDIRFFDTNILGGFSFEANEGPHCKWGALTYELGRSAYAAPGFVFHDGEVSGIRKEHAWYMHNTIGDCSFQRVKIKGCGRTGFQFANRQGEGPEGKGDIYIADSVIEDVGLQMSGGGSAITIKGGHVGTYLLKNVKVKQGGNPDIHPDFSDNITGCVVAHKGGDAWDAKPSLMIGAGSKFVMGKVNPGKGAARRPAVDVANLKLFKMRNSIIEVGVNAREALVIDPDTIDKIQLDDSNTVLGNCQWGEDKYPDPHRNGQGYRDMIQEHCGVET